MMLLGNKGQVAVAAMLDIALREMSGPVPLPGIAARNQISLSYLEPIFGRLRDGELVCSIRGPGGGYRLARSSCAITVADIVSAVDSASLLGKAKNPTPMQAIVCKLWNSMADQILDQMRLVTLENLLSDLAIDRTAVEAASTPKRGVFPRPVQAAWPTDIPNSVFALAQAATTT
jgi:Rrf2 family iron-sulfur cluster assembly transcriptional regulator